MKSNPPQNSFWNILWKQFKKHPIGKSASVVVLFFICVAIYAPFLASSKPLIVLYDSQLYFPLFRYLFHSGFFTKRLDIFFNLFIFTLPLFLLPFKLLKFQKHFMVLACFTHISFFLYFSFSETRDPASDPFLNQQRQSLIQKQIKDEKTSSLLSNIPQILSWKDDLKFLNDYARLNLVLRHIQRKEQHQRLQKYSQSYEERSHKTLPSLWQVEKDHEEKEILDKQQILSTSQPRYIKEKSWFTKFQESHSKSDSSTLLSPEETKSLHKARRVIKNYEKKKADIQAIYDKRAWLESEEKKVSFVLMPLLRPFHWEDDAGGEQALNQHVDWWELTRINRKDLSAALIFGIRISLVVGFSSVLLALIIGVPIGALSGYFGGKVDILVFRLLEIWESMPTLFMLLLVVAVLQTKSIFLVIAVQGIFGWTGFCRFVRGETLKQRNLPYVDACRALGFSNRRIVFSHILPNAIPPLLTLLPFSIMGAITGEAGLSFLGLGEEGSCSWGVLMDEGRSAFPGESYLLWPPGLLLTLLLVSIALVGDALRDAFDPKMRS